jgi:hypothetical protein
MRYDTFIEEAIKAGFTLDQAEFMWSYLLCLTNELERMVVKLEDPEGWS